MNDIRSIEAARLEQQAYLDSQKSPKERNLLGQFATPPRLALDIARYLHRRWKDRDPVRFLDPAIGTGSFYSALLQAFPHDQIDRAQGCEIDPRFVNAARRLWGKTDLVIRKADFTQLSPPEDDSRFNLVLTNPPYVRHHHLTRSVKEHLQRKVLRSLGLPVNGLAGLYCYFMLLTHEWMQEGGLAAWLIPTEFMDVNYGQALKRYLLDKVRLIHIHRFQADDVQFGDALVTSAIVVFEKSRPTSRQKVRFSSGPSLSRPVESENVSREDLLNAPKWSVYPRKESARKIQTTTTAMLGDLFTIKRGLATGANRFFILSREEADSHGIPSLALRPILPSPRYVTEQIIERDPDGYPAVSPRLALLDCNIPESVIQREYPRFADYLEGGKASGIPSGYLASRRSPWYSQEQRRPAPFLCTYMGRNAGGRSPFRFFLNRSDATAANVYLLLYPKGALSVALKNRPDLYVEVLSILQDIEPEDVVGAGRVYGGGLHKVEPRELARVPADTILTIISGVEPASQPELFPEEYRSR
ncbi:MAG: SAM-dependent DNA methyltransferase [Candidatus Eisenbacteria bacterium]|nr:SAM-dependent DNA methyltransferase [Candidatus Eisenbacteria bacterium]